VSLKRTKPPCQGEGPTPKCQKTCESTYKTPYKADKHFGGKAYSVKSTVEAIATDIMTNGPVEGWEKKTFNSFNFYFKTKNYFSTLKVPSLFILTF